MDDETQPKVINNRQVLSLISWLTLNLDELVMDKSRIVDNPVIEVRDVIHLGRPEPRVEEIVVLCDLLEIEQELVDAAINLNDITASQRVETTLLAYASVYWVF